MTKSFLIAAVIAASTTLCVPAFAQEALYLGTSDRLQDNAHQSTLIEPSNTVERDLITDGTLTYGVPRTATNVSPNHSPSSASSPNSPYRGTSDHGQDNADTPQRF